MSWADARSLQQLLKAGEMGYLGLSWPCRSPRRHYWVGGVAALTNAEEKLAKFEKEVSRSFDRGLAEEFPALGSRNWRDPGVTFESLKESAFKKAYEVARLAPALAKKKQKLLWAEEGAVQVRSPFSRQDRRQEQ